MGFWVVFLPLYSKAFEVKREDDTLIVQNQLIRIIFDSKHNFVITNFSFRGKRLLKSVQVVADIENPKKTSYLEYYATTKRVNIKQDSDKFTLQVHWQNKYLDTQKTITIFKKYPVVVVHYDFYIINRLPLRVFSAPLIDLDDRFESVSYQDRVGKVHSCKVADLSKKPFGKFSCKNPGIWYSAKNKINGLLIVVPKLISEYGNFTWPPEFGGGRQLVRNYDVGRVGVFFPHRLAYGSPDTRFSATVVLSAYRNGNIKSTIDTISKLTGIEEPKFKPAPKNTSARYKGFRDGIDLWVDWQSGLHRKNEKISKERKSSNPFEIYSAKNQYISFQVIINPKTEVKLKNVYVENIPFTSEIRLCKYIKLPKPSRIFPERDPRDYPSYWPDPLIKFQPIKINGGINQGIWITIYIPQDTIANTYRGKVKLEFEEKSIYTDFNLHVFDFALPTPRTFKNITDVYGEMIRNGRGQSPRKYIDAYSSEIENLYAELFTKYNLSVISYYERPFSVDVIKKYWQRCSAISLPGSEAMIIFEGKYWPKYLNGKKYTKGDANYLKSAVEVFRRRIDYYRQAGLTSKIYAIITDDALYRKDFREFLSKFIPNIRILDDKLVIVGCIKSNFDEELAELFDVVITGVDLDDDIESAITQAIDSGKIQAHWSVLNQWTAIDADPIELRTIFWKLFTKGITGNWNWDGLWFWFLTDDVYAKPKLNNWWGEGYLVYPPNYDPAPSIRLAQIRAGIDDYEYLTILKNLGREDLLPKISQVSTISVDRLEKYRIKVGKTIEMMKKGVNYEPK